MFQQLSYTHPRVYQQILSAGLVVVLLSGLVNLLQPVVVRYEQERVIAVAPAPMAAVVVAESATTVAPPAAVLPSSLPSYRPSDTVTNPIDLARQINAAWFGDQYWSDLENIWIRESGFNPNSHNRSSGACGIPQALPCSKITDHTTAGQIVWGLGYIQSRYGNPANAWRFWQLHHWY